MNARNAPWKAYRGFPANTGRSILERSYLRTDVAIERLVVALSLGICGAAALVAGNVGILVLGLVPILAFEYLIDH